MCKTVAPGSLVPIGEVVDSGIIRIHTLFHSLSACLRAPGLRCSPY